MGIKSLIEEQTKFNGLLLTRVGNYLVESWRMLKRGASDREVNKYKKEEKKKMEKSFAEQSKSTQRRIEREIEANQQGIRHGAYRKASVPQYGQGAHAQGNEQKYQQGGQGQGG